MCQKPDPAKSISDAFMDYVEYCYVTGQSVTGEEKDDDDDEK